MRLSRSLPRVLWIGAMLVVIALAGCGANNDTGDASAEATTADPVTTTSAAVATTASEAVTTTSELATTTTEAETTTTEAGPDYPTYAEYVAALPPGTETCNSQGEVADMGDGMVSVSGPDAQVSIVDGQMVVFCPGAKLVVGEPFTGENQYGEPHEMGALFSVNPDGSFVQLSSF